MPDPIPTQTQPPRPDLSVVIPVWNGDHNLGKLLPRLWNMVAPR